MTASGATIKAMGEAERTAGPTEAGDMGEAVTTMVEITEAMEAGLMADTGEVVGVVEEEEVGMVLRRVDIIPEGLNIILMVATDQSAITTWIIHSLSHAILLSLSIFFSFFFLEYLFLHFVTFNCIFFVRYFNEHMIKDLITELVLSGY